MATSATCADYPSSEDYDNDKREACKYGKLCYQKNFKHLARFKHPVKDDIKPPDPTASSKRTRVNSDAKNHEEQPRRKQPKNDDLRDYLTTEGDLPASPLDIRANIKQKFLVEMPDDFYSLWKFCKSLDSEHPEDTFKGVHLQLVGAFDVLAGCLTKVTKQSEYLCHYRYYYDPPEFQTVIKGDDSTQYHIGYFRDSPDELPAFVGFNEASKGCTIVPLGENLFAAVNDIITDELLNQEDKQLESIQVALQSWAKKNSFNLKKMTVKMKARDKAVVAKGFHGAGIVVPYDKKTSVGYRPLPESNANLRKILQQIINCKSDAERAEKFTSLQEIITLVHFANDECDYGMGYELSLALFCFGHTYFHRTIELLMPLAYNLLHHPEFAQILEAHLKNRKERSDPVTTIKRK